MIQWDIDYDANAAYARLGGGKIDHTKEAAPGVMVDVDSSGNPIGVELLDLRVQPSLQQLVDECGLPESVALALCGTSRPELIFESASVGRQGAIFREPVLA